jgi:hypothetical protein
VFVSRMTRLLAVALVGLVILLVRRRSTILTLRLRLVDVDEGD